MGWCAATFEEDEIFPGVRTSKGLIGSCIFFETMHLESDRSVEQALRVEAQKMGLKDWTNDDDEETSPRGIELLDWHYDGPNHVRCGLCGKHVFDEENRFMCT